MPAVLQPNAYIQRAILYSFVLFFAMACYAPALYGEFLFDDIKAVRRNADVRVHTPLWEVLSHDFWGTPLTRSESNKSYRPVTVLLFRVVFSFSDGPAVFHVVNAVFHAIVSVLVVPFAKKLGTDHTGAFTAALLFASHPIHTDAVCSVVGTAESLAAMLAICGFLFCHNDRAFLGTVCCLCAALAKETALMWLALFCAIAAANACRGRFWQDRRSTIVLLRKIAAPALALLAFTAFRRVIAGASISPVIYSIDNPFATIANSVARRLSLAKSALYHGYLIFWPFSLSADYSLECLTPVQSAWSPAGILVIAATTALAALVLADVLRTCLPRRYPRASRTASQIRFDSAGWAVGLAFVLFLPATNIFFYVGFSVAERVLYGPSIPLCVYAGSRLCARASIPRKVRRAALLLVLVAFAARTLSRCHDWRSEESLFKSALDVCPRSAKALANFASARVSRDPAGSKPLLEKALSIYRKDPTTWKNLGVAKYYLGDKRGALEAYREALRIDPGAAETWNNAAVLYQEANQFEEALQCYRAALRFAPSYSNALLNMAILLEQMSRVDEAAKNYERFVRMEESRGGVAMFRAGTMMMRQRRHEHAVQYLKRAVQLEPRDPASWGNLALSLSALGQIEPSLDAAAKALALDAGDQDVRRAVSIVKARAERLQDVSRRN